MNKAGSLCLGADCIVHATQVEVDVQVYTCVIELVMVTRLGVVCVGVLG
jgi:hypothetical protein